MKIRTLYKIFESQGSTIFMGADILGDAIMGQLTFALSIRGLVIQSASMKSNIPEIDEYLMVARKVQFQIKMEQMRQPEPIAKKRDRDDSPIPVKRTKEGQDAPYRWSRFDPGESAPPEVRQMERALMRYHNRKKTHGQSFIRPPRKIRPRISIEGILEARSPRGVPLKLQVLAVFRERSDETEWEIRIFGFPDDFVYEILPGCYHAQAWRTIGFKSPALYLASGPFNTVAGFASVPLERGVNFVVFALFPPRLNAMAGTPGNLVLCGTMRYGDDDPAPLPDVDLSSFPPLPFTLGPISLEHGSFSIRSRWVDSGGADPLDAEYGGGGYTSGGLVLETEVACAGYCKIEGRRVLFWSDIPHDDAVLTFSAKQPVVLLPFSTGFGLPTFIRGKGVIPVTDLSSLDVFVGSGQWRKEYRFQGNLAQGHPYLIRALTIFHDLVLQRPVNLNIHVQSTRPFMLVGLEEFKIEPYEIGWNIRFTGSGNPVLVTAGGTLVCPLGEFEAVVEQPSFKVYAHDDSSAVNPDGLSRQPYIEHLNAHVGGYLQDSYEGLYMEIELGFTGYRFSAVGCGGDGDNGEIEWR